MNLPAQSIAAIGAVVAALITGMIAFVNLTLTKEQKTSEFRQAWIEGLREDLAVLFASIRAAVRAFDEVRRPENTRADDESSAFTPQKISEMRFQTAETFYRIQLRLNPDEEEHKELLRLIRRSIDELNDSLAERRPASAALEPLEIAAKYAQPVLKAEWKRVKKGELPFRVARNWVAPLTVGLALAFIAFLATGTFKP